MISLYRPGTSRLHRWPAGPKLAAVAVATTTISLAPAKPWLPAVLVVVVAGCYLPAGLGAGEPARQLWRLRWVLLIVVLTQIFFLPGPVVATNAGRVAAVILLANLVTLTTPTDGIIAALERALRPLSRLGVNPGRTALMLSLTITTIPVVAGFATRIREAQRARGVPVSPLALVIPLLVMALKHADDLADALTARGAD